MTPPDEERQETAEEVLAQEFDLGNFGGSDNDEPAEEEEPQAPEVEPPPAEEEPEGGEPPTEEEPAGEPEPAPAKPPYEQPELVKLREETSDLRRTVAALMARDAERQPAPPAPTGQPEERVFGIQVPDALVDAMSSEDPRARKVALEALVNGVAELTRKQILTEVNTATMRQVDGRVAATLTQQERDATVAKDFYGKYPELDNPTFRPMVLAVASEINRSRGITEWSPELRDLIGSTVQARLKAAAGTSSPPVPQPRRASAPPRRVGQGTRAGADAVGGQTDVGKLLGL